MTYFAYYRESGLIEGLIHTDVPPPDNLPQITFEKASESQVTRFVELQSQRGAERVNIKELDPDNPLSYRHRDWKREIISFIYNTRGVNPTVIRLVFKIPEREAVDYWQRYIY